ncbi:hypothetical protein [Streptomyces parvulus]|uniref:hypothetical protein n=1 Tax=Streptomyces parvulus TaxID=146923 RepID=UPI0033C600F4
MTFTPKTWVVGEVVSAAMLNQEIRDQFLSFFGAWTDYTPSWIAESGGTPNVANGSLTGRYLKVGRRVDFLIRLNVGSTTTFGNSNANWAFGLPTSPAASFAGARAAAVSFRGSAGEARGSAEISTNNGGTARAIAGGSVDSGTNRPDASFWDQSNPLVAASGMTVTINGTYESAS